MNERSTPRPRRTEDKRPEANGEREDDEPGTIRRGDHGVGGQSE